jgi:GT2 family glycosyltransferase
MALANIRVKRTNDGTSRADQEVICNGHCPSIQQRVRVDGKFFARGRQRVCIHGVIYGPFAPDQDGQPFPAPPLVREDLARMRAAGINSIRTYHVPPEWLLDLANESGMTVFVGVPWVDVPWRQHLSFLGSRTGRGDARAFVRRAAKLCAKHSSTLALCVGNEFPPDVLRWHGARRVERFLAELADVCRQADPEGLVTYASYPPTEYLDLSFADFITFNIYLHNRETFRRYLYRLQTLAGEKPLLLGELGMDTIRHGEEEQARFLGGHVGEALRMGLAGTFIFSWTDDWHTDGHPIEDWAFGITRADRSPKASYQALEEVFRRSPAELLPQKPRISVVVCSYNGGATLEQCLRSLMALEYPNYEVIVVDDGSTDNSRAILARFSDVRVIQQPNRGLSVARNVGLRAATGAIVAYTDSDCYADPDWLTILVDHLSCSGAAAVGGPNLSPEDGWMAACVAAAPGQPTHVLESDQVAEHVPGCNMAFRREALAAINGFDPQYRKAGDDVDVCWRLQQAGYWITFAPGAFVWHHRRQTPRAYLRQQAGYGQAEALLRFKHPDKFNGRGDGKWRGVLYGPSLLGLRLAPPIIYRGTFSAGFFQCLYQPGPAHWAMLPGTLEWHAAAALAGAAALLWPPAWLAVAAMLALSLGVAALQATQARLLPKHAGFRSRCLVAALCYLQPLVRSCARYRTRLFAYRSPRADPGHLEGRRERLTLRGCRTVAYWTGEGYERTELLGLVIAYLNERGWGKVIDSGWSDWDLLVYCHPWTAVELRTAQQDYGGRDRVICVRYRLRPCGYLRALGALALLAAGVAAGLQSWPAALGAAAILLVCAGLWWRGTCRASQALGVVDYLACGLGLVRCAPSPRPQGQAQAGVHGEAQAG